MGDELEGVTEVRGADLNESDLVIVRLDRVVDQEVAQTIHDQVERKLSEAGHGEVAVVVLPPEVMIEPTQREAFCEEFCGE